MNFKEGGRHETFNKRRCYELGAFYDEKNDKIYFNAATMNGSNGHLVSTLANELSHYVDAKNGREFDQERQDYSTKNEKDTLVEFEEYNGEVWLLKSYLI